MVCTLQRRMIFDWDAANVDHVARHGLTSTDCEEAYSNRSLVIKRQKRKRERRRLCLGETNNGRLLTFVVRRATGQNSIRHGLPDASANARDLPKRILMPTGIVIPRFTSETEEAKWWGAHPEVVTALFLNAKKEGRLERLPRIRGATKSVTIRLPIADNETTQEIGDQRGLPYQTFIFIRRWSGRTRRDQTRRRLTPTASCG